jgi:hypothetical protein
MLNVALHEAAHAVVAQNLGGKVYYVEFQKRSGCIYFHIDRLNKVQKASVYLAGYLAERMLMHLDVALIDPIYEGDLLKLKELGLTQTEYFKAMEIAKYIIDVHKKEIYAVMARILEQPLYTSWEGTISILEFRVGIYTDR